MYKDSNGLLVTQQLDGGDSCAETARWFFLLGFSKLKFNPPFLTEYELMLRPYKDLLNLLEVSPGIYVRNPSTGIPGINTYNNPKTTSRDQLQPVIWACGINKDYRRLLKLFIACLGRLLFAQNTLDTTTGGWKLPDQMWTCIPHFIRAGGWWTAILYPLLIPFDFLNLIGILMYLYMFPNPNYVWYNLTTWFTKIPFTSTDDNNTDCDLLAAIILKPTPITQLSRYLFRKLRPKNTGNQLSGSTNNCFAAMYDYHYQNNPEMVVLYNQPLITYMGDM